MTTVVLIPGAWVGAWIWEPVAAELERHGHTVFALTLSGLDGQAQSEANLDDHVADVVTFLSDHDLDDVVLCAHSYSGMVLRGVCDAVPQRCRGAIYIDGFLPETGESVWMLLGDDTKKAFMAAVSGDGRYVLPPPGSHPRATPHPAASLLQGSRAGHLRTDIRHGYIYATGAHGSPFTVAYNRLKLDPHWETYEIDGHHEVVRYNPIPLADLLQKILLNWG